MLLLLLLLLLLFVTVSMDTAVIVVIATVTMVAIYIVAAMSVVSDVCVIGFIRRDGCSYVPLAIQVVYGISNHFSVVSLRGNDTRRLKEASW